jgi:hypothetical protein
MSMNKRTTNVNHLHSRVKLTARVVGNDLELQWAEHYERGVLRGCGPTLAGLGGDLLHLCQMRLVDAPNSMLWSSS